MCCFELYFFLSVVVLIGKGYFKYFSVNLKCLILFVFMLFFISFRINKMMEFMFFGIVVF